MVFNLEKLNKVDAFSFVEKEGKVTIYTGHMIEINRLDDIHDIATKEQCNVVFALPYHCIQERGFEARGDEPILALAVKEQIGSFDIDGFKEILPHIEIELTKDITSNTSEDDYANIVRKFQKDEIETGNASQTNISRQFSGQINNMNLKQALSIYKDLLSTRGQYMTVLFANIKGDKLEDHHYIMGATPECHLEITNDTTTMMPIAGTLRKEDKESFEKRLQSFLINRKEISELYQVTDEELKMMGRICPEGGFIEGPFLKEIGEVIHTFYELSGKRGGNSIDALRHTLHAPTVVGSPMESAARIIKQYEPQSRRYYAGEFGIYDYLGRNTDYDYGNIDTAILIRCAEIYGDGTVVVQAGAGIVRDSDPVDEAKETTGKASVMLNILKGKQARRELFLTKEMHAKYHPTLMQRNNYLSKFWLNIQDEKPEININRKLTIINNEDDFSFMLAHLARKIGCVVDVVDTFDFDLAQDKSDIIVIGPGPGDINDPENARMVRLKNIVSKLRENKKPLLGICLGHQALASVEGMDVVRQATSSQGMQRMVSVFGGVHRLGFYNSFSPIYTQFVEKRGDLELDIDENGRVIAMMADDFVGFQFHPESIMSETGEALFVQALQKLS